MQDIYSDYWEPIKIILIQIKKIQKESSYKYLVEGKAEINVGIAPESWLESRDLLCYY